MKLGRGLGFATGNPDINTLPGTAAYGVSEIKPMAFFGQDSADKIATDSVDGTRRLTLPAGAFQVPDDTRDWYCVMRAKTGSRLGIANWETLASRGTSIGSATGSSGIGIYERSTASPAGRNWHWQLGLNNTASRDLLTGLTPALSTQDRVELGADYCIVFGVRSLVPYVGIQRVGAGSPHFRGAASNIGGFDNFYFTTAQYSNGTVERSGNVMTYRVASIATVYTTGATVYITSTAQPSINGIYTITGRLAANAGFTVASVGADFGVTATNASTRIMRVWTPGTTDIFATLGGLQTAVTSDNYGWGGGIGEVGMWYGTMPVTGGLIDADWLDNVTHRRIAKASMPGTLRYRNDCDPAASYAADSGGTITGALTAIGTPVRSPSSGADWLNIEPWDWHTPFASDLNPAGGSATGTVRLSFTSDYKTGSLFAQVEDASANVLLAERKVSSGSPSGGGAGVITLAGVPNGTGRYLRMRTRNGLSMLWGPFSVGPSLAWLSQSTINLLFQSGTGVALAPVSAATGIGTVGDVAGLLTSSLSDSGTNPTNRAGWCRRSSYPIGFAGSAGDGIKAFTNKMVELQNGVSGAAMAAAAWNLTRSGHPCDIYWSDRRTFTNAIGTATAGVALTGTWEPQPLWASAVTYCEAGTAKVYRGGTYAQIGDANSEWRLTGGTHIATVDGSGNWTAIGGSGVTGTFNKDTGAFSVTDPVGGALYIEAKMYFDTPNSTTSGGRTGTGFTVWGVDNSYDTGHIDNLLSRMKRQTAFVYSWANYLLGYANARSQAQVDAKVAFDIAMLRKRIDDNYPEHAGTPWIIACDARTKSTSSIGQHRIRNAMRAYALATPNTYWSIGPITGDMDAATNSPHPGPLASSGQLWGVTFAHGVAKALGIAGAKADEVYIASGTLGGGGTYVDLVFNVPGGASLTSADATKIEGLYFGTTDDTSAMTLVDVVGGTYSTSIPAANTVRVTKASGTFPATTYWNVNVGFVLTDAVFATENTRLANTLSLNSGGYNSIRPGQPVSFNPANVMVQ